jgi:peroxiredoxin
MPSIQKLYDKVNSDSVVFLMLSLDAPDQVEKVRKYIDKAGYTFPVFIAGELTAQTSVEIIPTTFVITPDGNVDYTKSGMADYDTKKFLKYLRKLSGSPAAD